MRSSVQTELARSARKTRLNRKNTVAKKSRNLPNFANSRPNHSYLVSKETPFSQSDKRRAEAPSRNVLEVNAPDLLQFEVLPREKVQITVTLSSKTIFEEEVCVEYQASTSFSARSAKMQIFSRFRAPRITIGNRIEKLGTLPLYSQVEFSLKLKNHESDCDYLVLRPGNFPNFDDDMVREVCELFRLWIDRLDICSPDFLDLEEVAQIDRTLKFFARAQALRFPNYIVKIPKHSTLELPVRLDNLYSEGGC